jgi:alkylation response protein AidB-like acyl-CoA dehydrogenase
MEYHPPRDDQAFLLFCLFDVKRAWRDIGAFGEFGDDLIRAVIDESGKLASQAIAPLNEPGDREGCRLEDGQVRTPAGFREAFAALAEGGWLGLSGNPEFGGQGMPKLLGCLIEEMFWAANASLYLYGTLTVGGSICIDAHGSAAQKARYLPRLYAGEWTAAMALTEAHAGTDLGIMRTRAEPHPDGTYRITGNKIFITSGDHDLADNIVHLVLARLPDAPEGTRGISLFIVPKYLPDEDGSAGERNAFAAGSLEHKMGIHGSATCVMNYDGATGFLVGEENQGLAAMFTMMNYERLSVGLQGLGAGELAYQAAVRYARERLQGRSPSGPVKRRRPGRSAAGACRRAPHAAHHACAQRRRARLRHVRRHAARPRQIRRRLPGPGLVGASHPHRQGLPHRPRLRVRRAGATGIRRPRLRGRVGRRADRAGCPDRPDLRGHQRGSGHGPDQPQGDPRRRRDAEGAARPICAGPSWRARASRAGGRRAAARRGGHRRGAGPRR